MRIEVLALVAAVMVVGCSDADVPPPEGPAAPRIEAIYGPAVETVLTPYPSDRYTVSDTTTKTGVRVRLTPETTGDALTLASGIAVDQLNALDGFSTTGGVIVSFTGPIDIAGITTDPEADPPDLRPVRDAEAYRDASAPFVLVDVDEASPRRGQAVGLIPRWWAQAKDDFYLHDEFTLVAQPSVPLTPGTRYVFVATRRLHDLAGREVVRSAGTEALLADPPTDDYAARVQAGLAEVERSLGIPRADVVLATAFTTATIHDEVLGMATATRARPAPALASPWEVETPVAAPDPRVRFKARFETHEYRRPLPDGKWAIEDGRPVTQGTVPLEVFVAFSDATRSGPRPVVIFGHGLGDDKDGSWGTAERLASIDAAVFAIDSPEHGSRSSTPDNPISATLSFFGISAETSSFDIGRARDNFRQMASDQLELVRFIATLGDLDLLPAGAPDGVPDLDVSRILYIGHSFGAVQGPTVFALAPEIRHAVWNVGGDGLTTILRDSGTFGLLVDALKPTGTPDGAVARFFAVSQAIVDPGDPLNFARYGTTEALPGVPDWVPRDVLLQVVVDDNIVPNSSSEALGRAAGLDHLEPLRPISGLPVAMGELTGNLASGATGALSQFDLVNGLQTSHGELIFADEAIAQYTTFFRTGLEAGHATVAPPY